jgi:hypothetical protein
MIEKKLDKYLLEQIKGRYSDKPVNRRLMGKVAMDCEWNLDEVFDFILELLEDVNAHNEHIQVQRIFDRSWRDFR